MKTLCMIVLASAVAVAQSSSESDILSKIRDEGLKRSEVDPVFTELTVAIGPRLTASPAHKHAAEWVRARLESRGLSNVHLEPWKFGPGWTMDKLTVEMIEPRYLPLIGYADGWSASTKGELVAAPVFVGDKTAEDIGAMASSLKGAIVRTQPVLANFVRKDRPHPGDPGYEPMSAA